MVLDDLPDARVAQRRSQGTDVEIGQGIDQEVLAPERQLDEADLLVISMKRVRLGVHPERSVPHAVENLRERYPATQVIGLWVDDTWSVHEV